MTIIQIPEPPPDPKPQPTRDRYDRYIIGGKPHTRVTTIAKTIDDTYNLTKWGKRLVAQGVASNPRIAGQIVAAAGNKKQLDAICEQALDAAGGNEARNIGDLLHRLCELVDLGQEPAHIPDPWAADIDAYKQAIHTHRLTPEHVEVILVNPDMGYAGTADNLYRLPDGRLLVGDRKTGGYMSWHTFAVQLALYANATHLYNPGADQLTPAPNIDRAEGIIVHLPAGQATCRLHTIDLTAGWEAAQLSIAARAWITRRDIHTPYTPTNWAVTQPPEPGADPLLSLIHI